MTTSISFTSQRPNRNPLRVVAVVAMSLALVGGFLFDVARQVGVQAPVGAELRT